MAKSASFQVVPLPSADEHAVETALAAYTRKCANLMGLRDWTFEVHLAPLEDALATCSPVFGRKIAEIKFALGIEREDVEVVRHATAHELVHPHLHPVHEWAREMGEEWMPPKTVAMFNAALLLKVEHAADALAEIIAPSLPLIEWA